ncbi:MAG: single-stranded-DNA-specific exonuclease RecJ [Clostridia bacterium]|nr:single-stranded-DNA-specific exonuclease RecJ [Clostridia bacterium]
MNKKWEIYKTDEEKIKKITRKYGINRILAKIILNRGVKEFDIDNFLYPKRDNFYNPYLMPDMEKAISRIIEAINKKEKVIVYGDYDVDGITSICVIKKYLEDRGLKVDYYIPNRLIEGYGLNKAAIDKILSDNYTLMITVDCGISGIDEVNYANSLGVDVIITDHHEPGNNLPNAIAVVDAKRKDSKYPFNQLAGVGVAFKLIHALNLELNLDPKEFLKYLDIVCIGTISDIVPLFDENRVISSLGLKLVNQTKNIGLKSLFKSMGYNKLDASSISFGVAPRINACGRMGFEKEAMELFLTDNIVESERITRNLNEYNKKRQEIEKKIYDDVLQKAKKEREKDCIILGSDNWHHGIIGIVSSKITEKFYKPSILICFENNIGKGSGRSIEGFDLYKTVSSCSDSLDNFGGHEMAVGVTIKKEKFSIFKNEIEKYVAKSDIKKILPVIKIDAQIELKNINLKLAESLAVLEPYGANYKKPLFLIRNLKISSITTLSSGKHLKMVLKDREYVISAVGFGKGEFADEYQIGDKVDIVGNIDINEYKSYKTIQIIVQDMKASSQMI